jgi:hypothetical protein
LPQLIPGGLELTSPDPVPVFETLTVDVFGTNVALTDRAWLIITWQLPLPAQSPDQPAKAESAPGVAVNVTVLATLKLAWQVMLQLLIPAGLVLTCPEPMPCLVTVRRNVFAVNVAVTDLACCMVTWQSPAPAQSPDQPVNVEPESGVALSLTTVSWSKLGSQSVVQTTSPWRSSVTCPEPDPAVDTVRPNGPRFHHWPVGASHQAAFTCAGLSVWG